MTWTDQAACVGQPTVWWLPTGPTYGPDQLRALEICDGCPVTDPCLAEALDWPAAEDDALGIRGGLSPRARRRVRYHNADPRVERVRVLRDTQQRNTSHHGRARRTA